MPTPEQEADREVREREAAVEHVSDLSAERPSALPVPPGATMIGDLVAPHADP
jgi:hypothetical protein